MSYKEHVQRNTLGRQFAQTSGQPRAYVIPLVAIVLASFSACSTVLMNTPMYQRTDGWTITLSQVRDGPDTYPTPQIHYDPGKGEKFIWTLVTVRNDLSSVRTFSYDACDLDGDGQTFLPVLVDRHTFLNALTDKTESFDPGQERTRQLIYSYPKNSRPTRVQCGPIAFPVPQAR